MNKPEPIVCPNGIVLIPLTKTKFTGLYTKIDYDDFERINVNNWTALWDPTTQSYYAHRRDGKRHLKLHRFILGLVDPKIQVDHINHDTLDNRKQNLRITNNRGNCHNKPINKSGYLGVSKRGESYKGDKRWAAYIKIDGKTKNLGYYCSPIEASMAYQEALLNLKVVLDGKTNS